MNYERIYDENIIEIQRNAYAAIMPPLRLPLADWIEDNIYLPARSSPIPGRMHLWKYQRGWCEAIGDRRYSRVSVMKSARTGFTKCLDGTIGHFACNRPAAVILLVPTEDDARRYSLDEIQPMFEESPCLEGLMSGAGMGWSGAPDRDTMTMKSFTRGGTLKILSARSPRNLRSHDCKILLMDEVDGYEVTAEGDPVALAEKRTLAHEDRKIICGSTPTIDGISVIQRKYAESDRRVFEIPCPKCGREFELLWQHLSWPQDDPHGAFAVCPACAKEITESFKAEMVENGEWRATAPQVEGHAGFRINALVSLFKNARWGFLAEEYLKAKRGGPSLLQVFENTSLGRVSKQSIDSIDENFLKTKTESFTLDHMPPEICLLTCGVDTQHDRLEACVTGWSGINQPYILGYMIIYGSTIEDQTWKDLDTFLSRKWRHPHNYSIGIEATAIDSGGTGTGPESRTQKVYNFTDMRTWRHIYAIKGVAGPRPVWKQSFSKKANAAKLFLVGVDQLKTEVLERMAALPFIDIAGEPAMEDSGAGRNVQSFRLSDQLPDSYFEQVASERRYIRYLHNRPLIEFRPIQQGMRNEALDATVYSLAARASVPYVNLPERLKRRGEQATGERLPVKRKLSDFGKFSGLRR